MSEKYPLSDWQYEVANGDTKLGYDAWFRHQVEANDEKFEKECDKMLAVRDESHTLSMFLDWLIDQGIRLARYDDDDRLCPIIKTFERLLAEYFEIDLDKVEEERRALLDQLASQ